MRRRKRIPLRSALGLASVAIGAAAGPVAAQERAGVAGAVIPQSSSQKPGATRQTLTIGAEVVRNERIATDASGRAQVMLLDQSAITVGANSEVVIDEFVYNPAQDVGSATVTLGRGVMRFVGGRLTKGRDATLNTPVATIGVRGAIAIAEIQPDRSVIALLVYGDRMSIRSSSDATRVLTQSGLAIDIAANGAIGNPYFPPPALLARLLELLGPTGESTGEQLPIPPPVLLPGRDGGIDLPRLRELLIQSRPTFGY